MAHGECAAFRAQNQVAPINHCFSEAGPLKLLASFATVDCHGVAWGCAEVSLWWRPRQCLGLLQESAAIFLLHEATRFATLLHLAVPPTGGKRGGQGQCLSISMAALELLLQWFPCMSLSFVLHLAFALCLP